MEPQSQVALLALEWGDGAALLLFVACIVGITWAIERPEPAPQSVGRMMRRHRERWMAEMAERKVRIVDSNLLNILHNGAGFFASASLIAIGGVVALIGSADKLLTVAGDLAAGDVNRAVWELKLLFLLMVLVLALLSFIWSLRLFSYCAVLIGATPEPDGENDRQIVAAQAAMVNIRAGRSFNRGLRMLYYALASMAWLLGPVAFVLATLATTMMLYRREFLSETRNVLADGAEHRGADDQDRDR